MLPRHKECNVVSNWFCWRSERIGLLPHTYTRAVLCPAQPCGHTSIRCVAVRVSALCCVDAVFSQTNCLPCSGNALTDLCIVMRIQAMGCDGWVWPPHPPESLPVHLCAHGIQGDDCILQHQCYCLGSNHSSCKIELNNR